VAWPPSLRAGRYRRRALGTLINITSTLLTVQPTEQELTAGCQQLRAIPGVGVVAPQCIVRAQADGRALT
jgi:putative ABC transport system permease protein